MRKICLATIGLTLMVALSTLTNPCLAQQQSMTEAFYNSVPKTYNFFRAAEVNVGEYELGKTFVAGKDEADPPPKQ